MIDCALISEALESYEPDEHVADVLKAEEQRAELQTRFPKNEWPAMTLDRYALGRPEFPDNFCRWMEFVSSEVGSIRGGTSRKHLIYYQAGAGEWWFDRSSYPSVQDAWLAVRRGFEEAIADADSRRWSHVQEIAAVRSGWALVNKTLSVYFPDDLLPINSQEHLRHFLEELGDSRARDSKFGTTTLNRMLLDGLRECGELDGWTTKEIERLLYSSRFSPFLADRVGSIEDIAAFISTTLAEAGDDRLDARRRSEDHARKLLDEYAGRMSAEQVRSLLALFNADFESGKTYKTRFSPAFVGQTANALVGNLDRFNEWTGRMWQSDVDAGLVAAGVVLDDKKTLPSAGTSYPTMLMYLREPERRAVWLTITDRGLQRLTSYVPRKRTLGGAREYAEFCRAAAQLMEDYEIPPELLDYILAAAGRAETPADRKPPAPGAAVWVFQANPSVYDIDQALTGLSELAWVVRQHKNEIQKGDRVYLWRSGPEAGVVATATITTDPAVMSIEEDDPYLRKHEALGRPELRVLLRIDSVLPTPIRRSDLLEHAVLNDLAVIHFANATNFRVSEEQDNALRALLTGFRIPPLRQDIEDRVHLPVSWLQEAVDLATEKGQVVFYGPPGTGKTFVALALAEELTREGGGFRVVQFHPSYSYEDFVGGFRPVVDDRAQGVRYERVDGPLRGIAKAAAADASHPYILIVDEINRGNIPRIFGELLFLLEYRQKSVRLQYWPDEEFTLPANLLVIGTMNTADRSIALVDAALRRRFYFVPFIPTAPPVSNVLRRWLARHGHPSDAAVLLDRLNQEIQRDEVAIGPSYFMTDPDQGPNLDRIWSRAIMPLLEEYYYGTAWKPDDFRLSKLQQGLGSQLLKDQPEEPGSPAEAPE